MGRLHVIATVLMVAALAGCRIVQVVPQGGSIVSGSGLHDCAEGQTCNVDMEEGVEFSETFTAQPRRGYVFDGWKKDRKHLCTKAGATCAINVPAEATGLDVEVYMSPVFSSDPDAAQTFLFVATSASNSEYFNDLGLVLESSTQYIFKMNVDTSEVVQVESNYSPSYARSTIRSYTVDDSFYVREAYETQHSLTAYDPVNLSYQSQISVFKGLERECSAVVGSGYFYKSYQDCDPFFGCTGGDLRKVELFGGSGSGAGNVMPTNECYGHLGSSAGVLYDTIYFHEWDGTTSAIGFYERDQVTGTATTLAEFFQPNGDLFQSYSFHYDGADIYIIRQYVAGGFEVLRWRIGVDAVPSQIYVSGSEYPPGFFPAYRDVDDGLVAVGSNEGFVLILDTETLTTQTIDFQTSIYDMQILYLSD